MNALAAIIADLAIFVTSILLIVIRVDGILRRFLYILVVTTMCLFVAAYSATCISKGKCAWTSQEFWNVAYCTLRPDQCAHLLPKFADTIQSEYWKGQALEKERENERLREIQRQAEQDAAKARRAAKQADSERAKAEALRQREAAARAAAEAEAERIKQETIEEKNERARQAASRRAKEEARRRIEEEEKRRRAVEARRRPRFLVAPAGVAGDAVRFGRAAPPWHTEPVGRAAPPW